MYNIRIFKNTRPKKLKPIYLIINFIKKILKHQQMLFSIFIFCEVQKFAQNFQSGKKKQNYNCQNFLFHQLYNITLFFSIFYILVIIITYNYLHSLPLPCDRLTMQNTHKQANFYLQQIFCYQQQQNQLYIQQLQILPFKFQNNLKFNNKSNLHIFVSIHANNNFFLMQNFLIVNFQLQLEKKTNTTNKT
eukprot:TRINITY_DN2398_c5_g1_i1.p3 TRINITY_DN2398_c5_g1~~TRINITY_DN2398_c5_g1_i1.p3  ORF type:complete len:190 (+),score=-14.38 TRINITY_DN2398_c5_g1_i1:476-1045(+)